MYLIFKVLKITTLWKPLFIAAGFALIVMVIRALVNLAATLALPNVYYPFDLTLGVTFSPWGAIFYPAQAVGSLFAESQAAFNTMQATTAAFNQITMVMTIIAYVWLGALCTVILGTLKPELSIMKRASISAGSIAITVLILWLLIGIF